MTLAQFGGLFIVYLVSVLFILTLAYQEFRRVRFNFNVFFTLLYLLTFYFGFPLTCLLVFQFDVEVVPVEFLLYAILSATAFYAIYYVSYKTRLRKRSVQPRKPVFTMNRVETHLTWMLLALVAMATVGIFFMQNGFLLFKLNSYSQIFSSDVSGVALKRFFYFFIPAMLVVYFLKQDLRAWFFFPGGDGGLWHPDLRDSWRYPRQYHYCLLAVSVYRHRARLDLVVDAGGRRRVWYRRHVLAGVKALQPGRQRSRSVLYLPLPDARYLLAMGKPGAVAAELRQD
jgi:hypothetical protein